MSNLVFDNETSFEQILRGDIANFTDIIPVRQISEILD